MMHRIPNNLICPSCSTPDMRFKGDIPPSCIFAGRMLNNELEGGGLYRCQRCRLFFRYPRRSAEVLNDLYRQENEGNWAGEVSQRTDWRLIRDWLVSLEGISRVLDVGCFDGRFLEYLGRDYQWLGVEINDKAVWRARA